MRKASCKLHLQHNRPLIPGIEHHVQQYPAGRLVSLPRATPLQSRSDGSSGSSNGDRGCNLFCLFTGKKKKEKGGRGDRCRLLGGNMEASKLHSLESCKAPNLHLYVRVVKTIKS